MKNVKVLITGIALLLISGCKDFRQGPGGMVYRIVDDRSGDAILPGDFTALTYTINAANGTKLYNSNDYDNRLAYKFREETKAKGDFFSALGLLSEGDSAIVKVDIDSLGRRPEEIGNTAIAGKYLTYHIRVNKVIARGLLNDSVYNGKIMAFKAEQNERARQLEVKKIKDFIAVSNMKPVSTSSGLNYVVTVVGVGAYPHPGDMVTLNYTAKFLGGKVFETNRRDIAEKAGIYNKLQVYGPRKVTVKKWQSLSGFDEALTLFPGGTKVILIIPSKLAFGGNLYNMVYPYTPIVCELEIISIAAPHSLTRKNI